MRCLLLSSFLFAWVQALAQPELRVYYNKFEQVGVSAGYSVNRWRFELNGSSYSNELIGPQRLRHPDHAVRVFEDDIWKRETTTLTGRIVKSGKKAGPRFGLYYGIYLRFVLQNSELTEKNWSTYELDFASRRSIVTSVEYREVCPGFVFGARGAIGQNVFWDASLALLPIVRGHQNWHYSNGHIDRTKLSGVTYLSADESHLLQVGIGYKFRQKKSE
jgi:hypothetical protein